jgi:signal transduction histidine kinase
LIEGSKGTLIFKNLPRIEGSKSQLYQLFLNLIKNGFKFRRADTPPVVTLGCIENGNNTWKISVENNGIGFDDKYSKKIFEPFQRLNPQGEFEGSGVGLAICEKIVMRHGGTIRAYGKLGEAAKFVVEWPREFSNFSLEPK